MDEEDPEGMGAFGIRLQGDTLVMPLPYPSDNEMTDFMLYEAYLAFFDGQRIQSRYAWKRYLNTAIGYVTHGFTHCEIAFRFLSTDLVHEIWMTCNIYTGENLQFEFKTNDYNQDEGSTLWSLYALDLNKDRLNALLCHCAADVRRGVAFNNMVYWNFLMPRFCRYDGGVQKVAFCSEHVATALKRVGCKGFRHIDPCTMDPTTLYNYVRTKQLFKQVRLSQGIVQEIMESGGLDLD